MDDNFYILSVDGGGFRGAFSAHILERMAKEWDIDWHERFGMLAGTSTGSILVAGLACGIRPQELTRFYRSYGEEIFSRRFRSRLDFLGIFTSKYSNRALRERLGEQLGKKTLGEITIPLILPSVDIGNGCVHVFKSKYADGFVRDPDVLVSDAVLASCSAPTFFDPCIVDDKYQLTDGGIWANNPSLVAVIDAHYRLRVPLEKIRVLSIGTGKAKTFYPRSSGKWRERLLRSWQGWGFVTRWQRTKLIDFILNLQSESAHNMLCLLLGESPLEPRNVFRLNFDSDQPLPMDDTTKHADWVAKADHKFSHNASRLKEFLQIGRDTSI